MHSFTYRIIDPQGLHARPVTALAAAALSCAASVRVTRLATGATADAKDLLQLMNLSAPCGEELLVELDGPDEAVIAAEQAIRAALASV